MIGFSGIIWNSHALHPRLQTLKDEGGRGASGALLRRKTAEARGPG